MQYKFVDEFAAVRPMVTGRGNLDRYEYWLNTFLYLRAIGELNCAWGAFNRAVEQARAQKDSAARKEQARALAVPARREVIRLTEVLYSHLLSTVTTVGELGTVANWNQHNVPVLLTRPGEELEEMLGEPLAADLQPAQRYRGPTRIIVPTKRTSIFAGEPLKLRVIVLSEERPASVQVHYRELGTGKYANKAVPHLGRGVYEVAVPWEGKEDLEYYVQLDPQSGAPLLYPPTAPQLNRTVVMWRPQSQL